MRRLGLILAILALCISTVGPAIGQIPDGKNKPSSEEGQVQIYAALAHCPQLETIVRPVTPVWDWLFRAFNNQDAGGRIVFDNRPILIRHTVSESGSFDGQGTLCVRVNPKYTEGTRIGEDRSPEEVLCTLVFELNNLGFTHDHEIIEHLARCGEIGREAYIYDCAQEEFFAFQKTSDFYKTVWLPFCAKNNIQANPQVWNIPLPKTFDEWLARYPKTYWYPWNFFGHRYEQESYGLSHPVELHPLIGNDLHDLSEAAAKGIPRAQERLGLAFLSGEAGSRDEKQAFGWISKAADQGDLFAEEHLKLMYRMGIGVEKNPSQSFAWSLKAASQEDAQAEFLLGAHYEVGFGVPKGLDRAVTWYQKSADQGYGTAEDKFGYELLTGEGVPKDPQRGLNYEEKAARGNAHASYVLAISYAHGFYTKQDLVQAYKWCLVSLGFDSEALDLSQQLKKQLSDTQIRQAESDAAAAL